MRTYADLIAAAKETAAKITRTGRAHVTITTLGGRTASVNMPTKRGGPVTINLPTLPEDARMTQGEADAILGYLLHELAHVLETDNAAWRRAVASGAELRDLVNGIEDVRIERAMPAKHGLPGAAELFGKLFSGHWRELRAQGWDGTDCTRTNVGGLAGFLGRALTVPGAPEEADARACLARLPAPERAMMKVVLRNLPRVGSTAAAVTLAEKALAARAAAAPPPPAPEPQQADTDPGKGEEEEKPQEGPGKGEEEKPQEERQEPQEGPAETEGEGMAEGDGDGEGDSEEGEEPGAGDGDAEGDGEGDGDGKAEGEGKPEGDKPGGTLGAPEGGGKALEEIAERVLKREGTTHEEERALGDLALRWGRNTSRAAGPAVSCGSRRDILPSLRTLTGPTAALSDAVSRMLRSRERWGTDRFLEVGRLDRRALARAAAGARNTQSRRSISPGMDTAVALLIDQSESMSEHTGSTFANRQPVSRSHATSAMALALSAAVEAAGADLLVTGFGTTEAGANGWPRLHLDTLKDWHERNTNAAVAERLAAGFGHHGTMLAPAIIETAEALRRRRADRRVMIALTDGQCFFETRGIAYGCKVARRMGVEVLAIVLGEDVGDGYANDAFGKGAWARALGPRDLTGGTLARLGATLADRPGTGR